MDGKKRMSLHWVLGGRGGGGGGWNLATLQSGAFTSFPQKRWKHPPDSSAHIGLEKRITDHALERLRRRQNKLQTALKIIHLMRRRNKNNFVSLQLMSKWRSLVGLNIRMGAFLHSYPHIFHVFTHPLHRNLCCKFTPKMEDLIKKEERAAQNSSVQNLIRLKKLLMMSSNHTLPTHSLRLVGTDLGFPSDFVESSISEHPQEFVLLASGSELKAVSVSRELGSAHVEKWRRKECLEKWLKESETRYAFPLNLPPQFVKEAGFDEMMRNWQLLPYVKAYESEREMGLCSYRGLKQREKRAVGIIHEFLCLTVEKMAAVDRLVFFMAGFGLKGVKIRELLLKHPGVFYISVRGGSLFVFLREAYCKGGLVAADHPVYDVRREMVEFMFRCDMGERVENVSASSSSSSTIFPRRTEDLKKKEV